MKAVALFLPHLEVSGGLGVHCRMLADTLAVAPFRITILAPSNPGEVFPTTGVEKYVAPFPVVRVNVRSAANLAEPLDAILAEPLAEFKPDLLYCSYYTGMLVPPCPQIVAFHDAGFLENPAGFGAVAAIRTATVQRIRDSIACLQCISHDARNRICEHLPWDRDRTTVVWHALPETEAEIAAAKAMPRREASPYFFLPVGAATGFNRLRKNVPNAVAAFRSLGRARLIIAGTATLTEKVLAELLPPEEMGVVIDGCWHSTDGAIEILPTLPRFEFLAAMHHAAAVIYPSRYEGFGLPLIEAMALDVPLIASRATSVPEIVEDAGILVNPDDVAGFRAAMRSALNDRDGMNTLVQKGRDRVKHFTRSRLAQEMIELFQSH